MNGGWVFFIFLFFGVHEMCWQLGVKERGLFVGEGYEMCWELREGIYRVLILICGGGRGGRRHLGC